MTHPRRHASIATVPVALGERSYEVLIGPGLLARAAELIEARLGRARCAIVTDANVAARHLAAARSRACRRRGRHTGTEILPPGEATKSFAALAGLCERLLEMGLERGDLRGRARRRRDRRSRRLRREHRAPRRALRADADDAAGAGGLLRRRQDRHQHAAGQEPGRRLPSAEPRARRHRRAGDAAAARVPRGLRRGRQVRPARRCRRSSLGWSRTGPAVFARDEPPRSPARSRPACRARPASSPATRRRRASACCSTSATRSAMRSRRGPASPDRLLHGEAIAIGICLAFRLSAGAGA